MNSITVNWRAYSISVSCISVLSWIMKGHNRIFFLPYYEIMYSSKYEMLLLQKT